MVTLPCKKCHCLPPPPVYESLAYSQTPHSPNNYEYITKDSPAKGSDFNGNGQKVSTLEVDCNCAPITVMCT